MAIRTVQILGMGFGANPTQITATANGTQVFSGTVTTVNQPAPAMPNFALVPDQVVMFSFEIDTAFTGLIPMTCTVDSGTVIFGEILANYIAVPNPVYSSEQLAVITDPAVPFSQKLTIYTAVANPPFSAEELAILQNPSVPYDPTKTDILNSHGCALMVSGGSTQYGEIDNTDPRANVYVDGLQQTPDHSELAGPWWWQISSGSTLAYNLEVDPAVV